MSGHSKWSTIKRKKGAADAKRGKIFSKLAKEITIAAKLGGGDPEANPRLRTVLLNARTHNMPKDNVEKAIQKGTGELPGVSYDEVRYEGYGPGGVAIIVDTLTDNRNRTVAEIRHALSKYGGSMAENGAVTWNFEQKGVITIPRGNHDPDLVFEQAIEAGSDDVEIGDEYFEVKTLPTDLHAVAEALESQGLEAESVELTMEPKTTVPVEEKDVKTLMKLMDALEEQDDVQNIYSNFDIAEELMAQAMAE